MGSLRGYQKYKKNIKYKTRFHHGAYHYKGGGNDENKVKDKNEGSGCACGALSPLQGPRILGVGARGVVGPRQGGSGLATLAS